MNFNKKTIFETIQGIKNKDFSVQELTSFYLKKIKEKNSKINAFVSIFEKESLMQAKKIDQEIANGILIGDLAGIPLAVKDNILIKGKLCSAGSKILKNYQAVYDATVIKKLKEQKAIILGKTNLDEFAMGSSTETSIFGPAKNPRNLEYVAGGSSGGSAAAVAGEMCLGSLGSDTGGSIRQPASFCGLVGLKPSYGRVSRSGLIAMASSLDQIGVLANNVVDAEILFKAIQGYDKLDSTSIPDFSKENQTNNLKKSKKIRIGLPKEYLVSGLDSLIKKKIDDLIKKLKEQKFEIEEVSLPHTKYALACYYIIMSAEASTNLSRYDGIRYGFNSSKSVQDLLDVYMNNRTEGFGEEVKRRIILGAYVLSSGYYEAYYCQAQKMRTLIKRDFEKVFKEKQIDILLTPTTPTTAFKLGEKLNDPLQMYLSDIYTVPVNLAGLPAMSLPIGEINSLPFGIQLIGNFLKEDLIFQTGKLIESL